MSSSYVELRGTELIFSINIDGAIRRTTHFETHSFQAFTGSLLVIEVGELCPQLFQQLLVKTRRDSIFSFFAYS